MSTTLTAIDSSPGNYTKSHPSYTVERIGEFSWDSSDSSFDLSAVHCKYLYEEMIGHPLHIDLLDGMHKAVEKHRELTLSKVFRWLMVNSSPDSSLLEAVHGCEFVTRRGPLSRLATAPYEADGFYDIGQKVALTKHKGVYFLREFQTATKVRNEESLSDYEQKMSFAGVKYEQIMTASDRKSKPNTKATINPNPEYNGVFVASLKAGTLPLRILCGAEMDCIMPSSDEFVELKTQFRRLGYGKNFETKAMKWWAQSHLIGIKQLAIGVHENFHLNNVHLFSVDSLHKSSYYWKPSVCLAFLHGFLTKCREELDLLPEGTILVAERRPNARKFTFSMIGVGDAVGQRTHEVLNEKFKAFNWT